MATITDSGTQPQPHYCEHPVDDLMPRKGCPDWPSCVRNALVEPDDDDDGDADDFEDEDEIPGIGRSLAALLGLAAAVALLLVVAAVLAPYLLGSALLP